MSATANLTAELRKEVLALEDDLRSRVATLPEVSAQWRGEYDAARAAERTAASWEEWRDERVTLAAVAWLLTTVFVRFCEDNGLVKPVWITHAGGRGREATDAQAYFLRETARTNPDVTDREWLLEAVGYLESLPATVGLVDETSPLWLVSPSGDAATRILNFWRERGDDGAPVRDLSNAELDTRFLGDLYQDISEAARKRYALLQTPVFVEEFILDRTLEPALVERPLEGFKAIDPTCGSGHFLLGLFARLLDRWHAHAPAMDERERVQNALDSVHGVDLNPFAVSIARFRLTVVALKACGMAQLEEAPAFRYHLAAGDSLLHGLDQEELAFGASLSRDRVAASAAHPVENLAELGRILRDGQYDCVVGNPPYVTVKDAALNALYRENFQYCKGKYALTVPFMERFHGLAKSGPLAGWVGQITSNSFTKREFGSRLVEEYLADLDLRLVADTSGVSIPGHGTPTLILVSRQHGRSSDTVRAVLGNRGVNGEAAAPELAPSWLSIVKNVDSPGWSDEWISVIDLDRSRLDGHPWSLSGGGADALLGAVEEARVSTLLDFGTDIGMTDLTGEDDVFTRPASILRERTREWSQVLVEGDNVRDYAIRAESVALLPVTLSGQELNPSLETQRLLWPNRTSLASRLYFGKSPQQRGLRWFDHAIFFPKRHKTSTFLTFPFVATHNHFVLTRSPYLFKQTAPVIKLGSDAPETYQALLGLLNSSVALFWMRAKCLPKPLSGEEWERRYEFDTTKMKRFPVPERMPVFRGALLDSLAQDYANLHPAEVVQRSTPTLEGLETASSEFARLRATLIAQQEELDWEVYNLYGLVSEDLTYSGDDLPKLKLGQRAFEIVLARQLRAGEGGTGWFQRHGSTPITELPSNWPAGYRGLVERRIELIQSDPYVGLLELPEHKRRWATESWAKQEKQALQGWLLDRVEDHRHWIDPQGRPTPKSIATLADELSRNAELVDVLTLWEGRPDVPVVSSLTKLLAKEGVPYLTAYRYKESGLRKRAAWEQTWDLQRREDAGTYDPSPRNRGGDGPIPVPPKYTSADFARTEYWSHRGKLDVPKERFILYPNAGRETDPTPVLGWAGWDHAQQALALATLIQDRQDLDGWTDEQLLPLVAGLAELLPWVEQWHAERSDLYGGISPAEFFGQQLEERMAQVSATRDTLREWRPAPPARGRKRKA